MKKIVAVVAGALVALPAMAQAQTATGNVAASATVQSALSVAATNPLNFGTAISAAGGNVTIALGAAPTGGTGQTLGSLQVSHNSDFSVAATVPTTLVSGTNSLGVSFLCGYSLTATGALTSETAGAACTALPNRDITLGTQTTTYLQVGGTLTVPTTAVAGTYTGTVAFTLTAVAS